MKVTLAQAGIVAGILTLSWVVGGPKEVYSAPSTGEYPHNVFNTTSKAHAEKVASLVPDSIVKPSGDWVVMSKTPDAEARSYFTPWLKENNYFRTNQFLSEVKYEAESFSAEPVNQYDWFRIYTESDALGDEMSDWYYGTDFETASRDFDEYTHGWDKVQLVGYTIDEDGNEDQDEIRFFLSGNTYDAESFSADWLVKRKKCKRPYCTKPIIVDFSGYCSSRCQAKNEPESYGHWAESHSAEDEDTTTCEDCGVKIGYDEAIDWEGLDRCEDCYDHWMMKDRQNYTGDETDCISCGYSISPNDSRFELVEGLCPDCKADDSFQADDYLEPCYVFFGKNDDKPVYVNHPPAHHPSHDSTNKGLAREWVAIQIDNERTWPSVKDAKEAFLRWLKKMKVKATMVRAVSHFPTEESRWKEIFTIPFAETTQVQIVEPHGDWLAESFSAEGEHSWWSPYAHMDGNWYICSNCGSQRAGGRKRKPNKAGCEGSKKSAESFAAEGTSRPYYLKTVDYGGAYPEGGIAAPFSEGIFTSRKAAKADMEKTLDIAKTQLDPEAQMIAGEDGIQYHIWGGEDNPGLQNAKCKWVKNRSHQGFTVHTAWGRWDIKYKPVKKLGAESFSAEGKMGEYAWVVIKEYTPRVGLRKNITTKKVEAVYLSTDEAKRGFNLSKGAYSGDWKDGAWEQEQRGYKQVPWGSLPMTITWDKVPIRRFGYDTLTHQKERTHDAESFSAEVFEARGKWNLYKSQEKVLKAYRDSGGKENDYDSIPIQIVNKLESIRNSETLWSDVNRWLSDNPSTSKNPYGGFHSSWDAESLADRVPFPSSVPSAGTGSPGQMCEVCNESDDLPYDSDYFKNCRRCGKTVCHECWDTDIESDDDYHEICMDCWNVSDNVARYGAEGDVTEDLAEVRTDLSQKRTNMSALRTALSVAGLFLVWDSWRWSKEERKLKGL